MLTQQPKIGSTVYWLSLDNNYLSNCIPIKVGHSLRLHQGTVVRGGKRSGARTVTVETFINEDFVKNFNGVITGLKTRKTKRGGLGMALGILSMPWEDLYASMDEVKIKQIEFIMQGDDD